MYWNHGLWLQNFAIFCYGNWVLLCVIVNFYRKRSCFPAKTQCMGSTVCDCGILQFRYGNWVLWCVILNFYCNRSCFELNLDVWGAQWCLFLWNFVLMYQKIGQAKDIMGEVYKTHEAIQWVGNLFIYVLFFCVYVYVLLKWMRIGNGVLDLWTRRFPHFRWSWLLLGVCKRCRGLTLLPICSKCQLKRRRRRSLWLG